MSIFNDLMEGAIQLTAPSTCKILDKERSIRQYVAYMLDRTNAMFEWDGLPETVPSYMLELYLQIFGYAAFVRVEETNSISIPSIVETPPGVYVLYGGIGGERDIYYRPKLFTAANPRIKNSIQSTILYPGDINEQEKFCVVMPNDRNYMGLLPLYNRYAQQLVENDISIRSAQINARAQVGISTSTDRDKETARKYLDDLEAGKLGVIGESAFLSGVSVSNVSTQSSNSIIQLIELQQYLKASWYNELGLNVNFNMKREYMSEEEIAVNTDILLPLVDDMLNCRTEYAEMVNKVFGLNISVHKASAWANKEQEVLASISEASIGGEIPLPSEIEDKIGGEKDESEIQTEVQPEVQNGIQSTGSGTEARSGDDSEASAINNAQDDQNIDGEPPVVVVVNNTLIGGDNNSDLEFKASPESQELDTESDST